MLLLFGYWGDVARELLGIINDRERRYQVALVLVLGLLLALGGTVFLVEMAPPFDFDGNGELGPEDRDFLHILWWSFRQVQDPGNLVPSMEHFGVLAVSIVLTFSGLLLFSFFVGIGTNVVDELVMRSRSRRLPYSNHTVILGLTPESSLLFRGLAEIYRKNLRPYRAAVLGLEPREPGYFADSTLRYFRYRYGDPTHAEDLERVSPQRAKRVIVLGPRSTNPDSEVLSTVLALRQANAEVDLYTDIEHGRNFLAVRSAGGPRTHLVGSGSLFGYYLAQNVVHPGIHRLLEELLESQGSEIYTYIFPPNERRLLANRQGDGLAIDPFREEAFLRFEVNIIGFFTAPDPEVDLPEHELDLWLNPDIPHGHRDASTPLPWHELRGIVGVARRFEKIRRLGLHLLRPRSEGHSSTPSTVAPAPVTFTLERPHPGVRRVLICGASPRIPRVITELVASSGGLEITVLARPGERFGTLPLDVRNMLQGLLNQPVEQVTDKSHEVTLRLRFEHLGRPGRISFARVDWNHRLHLEELELVPVEGADVILLLPAPGSSDSDGDIALDCLHLAQLEAADPQCFRPHLHVLALLQDPVKGQLLEQRLQAMGQETGNDTLYTVISRELIRHLFLMQCVFVRGLNGILLRLLRLHDQHLARLEPSPLAPGGHPQTFDPWHLRASLGARGIVLLGFELQTQDGPSVRIDPAVLGPDNAVPWNRVLALYVLGAEDQLNTLHPELTD